MKYATEVSPRIQPSRGGRGAGMCMLIRRSARQPVAGVHDGDLADLDTATFGQDGASPGERQRLLEIVAGDQ